MTSFEGGLFHMTPVSLAPGSIILPGNYERLRERALQTAIRNSQSCPSAESTAQLGKNVAKNKLEAQFEAVRKETNGSLPSRKSCVFLCPNLGSAREFAVSDGRWADLLYEVELVDPSAPLHETDHSLIDFRLDVLAQRQNAAAYWRSGHTSNLEVLTSSPVRIVQCLGEAMP